MNHSRPPLPGIRRAEFLVVDDDPISRDMLARMLRSSDFEVAMARDGEEAVELVRGRSAHPFEVIFADVQMPRMGGLELLARINAESPATATVIVTGNRERELVSASLRGGAVEFLDKPFDMRSVLRTALRGREMHRHRRHQLAADERLREVAEIHRRLNRSTVLSEAGLPARFSLRTRFHAMHEAGGDLVKVVVLPPDRVLLVLGDVSGHGMKEGFLAAYFQGVIEGMGRGAAGARDIAESFNDFLRTRWNDPGLIAVPASMSACFVELDLGARRLSVLSCGGTGARLVRPDGEFEILAPGGSPLGWFETIQAAEDAAPLRDEGRCWLWSDGLDDHAAMLCVPPLALAWRLFLAPEDAPPDPLLLGAGDDIVTCRLDWTRPDASSEPSSTWSPLHVEALPGDGETRIDDLHESWLRLLGLALPFVDEGRLRDIALSSREALLNAFQHGCRGDASRRVVHAFLLNDDATRLLLRVTDDGEGFDFEREAPSSEWGESGHVSLGLRMIRSLAFSTRHADGGRRFEAVFTLPSRL